MKIITSSSSYLLCLYVYYAEVSFAYLFSSTPSSPPSLCVKTHLEDDAGEPLLLTPLINAGEIEEARRLSKVEPFVDGIESFAGYLTVNKTTDSHLYFWFFPQTITINNSISNASTPLILWLQGGPGSSSLFGLFYENGPYQVRNGLLGVRIHAWTNEYNVLYIDQPVGTGFSFKDGQGYVGNKGQLAEHLYSALSQFYKLFSELKTRDLYIVGGSYAGKYIPAIGHEIHTMSSQKPAHVFKIPLKGLVIGSGFCDPENMLEFATHLRALGLIDKRESRQVEVMQSHMKYLVQSGDWIRAAELRFELLQFITNVTNLASLDDYTSDDRPNKSFIEFVSQPRIRHQIHVGRVPFNEGSPIVVANLAKDYMQSVTPWIAELLEHYPILFYTGQFDIGCAHSMTENFLDKLHWSGAAEFGRAAKYKWYVDGTLAGYYKSAANLVYVMVRNAGHMVPHDQPKNALNLMHMFIGKKFTNSSQKA